MRERVRAEARKRLGGGLMDHLEKDIVLRVGGESWSRAQMVEDLGCANFIAAARLTKTLKRLGIKSATGLFRLGPESLSRTKGVGDAQLLVAMCVLEASGHNVAAWWGWKPTATDKKHRQEA